MRPEDLATSTLRVTLLLDAHCSTARRCCSFASGASAIARYGSATIASLSTADRLPARACVYEVLASCSQGAFTAVDLPVDQRSSMAASVPARSVSAASTRARSDLIASGVLSVAPQAGRALFSCSAHDINAFPTGPGVKSTSARYGAGQLYIGRPQPYTVRRWTAISGLTCCKVAQAKRRTIAIKNLRR